MLARPRSFWEWDDYIFGLALHLFAPQAGVPQAPFFPAFVFAARALRPVVRDDAAALTWVSVAASILAFPLLYGIVRELLPSGRRVAVAATVVYAFLPPVWFYAGIPISDTAGVAGALLVLWLALRASSDPRCLPAAGAAFGLGCGIRPQSLLIAALPLAMALRGSIARGRILFLAASAASFALFWAVPVLVAAHGIRPLTGAFLERIRYTWTSTSAFAGIDASSFVHRWFRDPWVTTPFAIAGTALALTGAALLAIRGQRRILWILAGIVLPYAVVAGAFLDPTFSGRYVLPVLPVVAILVAVAAGALEERLGLSRVPLVTAAVVLAGFVLVAPALAILHRRVTPAEEAAAALKALAGPAPFAVVYPGEMYAPTALLFPGVPMWAAERATADEIRAATALPVWRFGVGSMTDPEEVACWPPLPAFQRLTPGRYLHVPFGPWSRSTPSFREGWSGEERMPDRDCRSRTFRWMEGRARVVFPPLAGALDLQLEALVPPRPSAAALSIAMNGLFLGRVAESGRRISARVPIPTGTLRPSDSNELVLFEDAAPDLRDRGAPSAARLQVIRLWLVATPPRGRGTM